MNTPAIPTSPPPAPGPPDCITSEEKSLAMLCHLLGLLTGFLGPLILWLIKKDSSRFIDHHGREAINFQITAFIVIFTLAIATAALMFVLVGFLLLPLLLVVPLLMLIAEILAAVAANNGQWHRYPCTIRFL